MYEAMARRYRPSTFDEVIGQEHVARTLKNAIAADRVAHAYLFCGPHGCGKTSMARIFARALVCTEGEQGAPCGTCELCHDIMRGVDVDVQEIDGASNNGVEQVRALREQAAYIPTRSKYKIYIIDEVHMLTLHAFNALLKTLEEPPPHVKFILATTDPHKVPDTVMSRVQRFDFRLVPVPRLRDFFRGLVEKENAAIAEDAVEAVAAFSGGSVRDGLVLLDQLLSYATGEVSREDVERVRGVAGAESVASLYDALMRHDLKAALSTVDEVARTGINAGDFLDQLIEFGRDLMFMVGTGSSEGISAYGPARDTLDRLAEEVGLDQILLSLDVLAQARVRVRSRALSNPLVPLEMAVARLAGLDDLEPVGEVLQKLDLLSRGAPLPQSRVAEVANYPANAVSPAPVAPASEPEKKTDKPAPIENASTPEPSAPDLSDSPSAAQADNVAEAQSAKTVNEEPDPAVEKTADVEHASPQEAASGLPWDDNEPSSEPEHKPEADAVEKDETADDPTMASQPEQAGGDSWAGSFDPSGSPQTLSVKELQAAWPGILKELRELYAPDLAFLHDVYPLRIEDGALVLSIPGGGNFIFEQLEDSRRKSRMSECAQKVLGQKLSIRLEMDESNVPEEAGAPDGSSSTPASVRMSGEAKARQEAQIDPSVRMVLEQFNGEIVNVEEDRD